MPFYIYSHYTDKYLTRYIETNSQYLNIFHSHLESNLIIIEDFH